jgi:L-rhamnose mutarotase
VPASLLTLDLKSRRGAAAYRKHHAAVWPEVLRSLRRVGVKEMEIFALGRRLVMVLETRRGFDPARDFARHRASHPRCAEWEDLMKGYQRSPPDAPRGALWTPMERVFSLSRQLAALDAPRRKSRRPARQKTMKTRP